MNPDMIMVVGQRALETMLLLAMPMLLVALLVGLLVGVFQAATQINEMTLSFIPKLLVLSAALFVAGTSGEGGAAAAAGPSPPPSAAAAAAASSPTQARYCIISLAVSVFPAPDSPETRIDWLRCRRRLLPPFSPPPPPPPPPGASLLIALYAASATAYTCGLSSPRRVPRYCSIMCFP